MAVLANDVRTTLTIDVPHLPRLPVAPAAVNPWLLVGVVMVGNFLGPLYSSVANIVLPNLVATFGSDVDTMEWVITGYMLGYSIAMPIAGWLADTFGRRRIYLIGLVSSPSRRS